MRSIASGAASSVPGGHREGTPQQRAHRRGAPVEDEREVVVDEQPRGMRPLAGCVLVTDGFDDVAVLLVPLGRGAVQRRDLRRRDAPQLEAQEVGEQVVVAEPRAGGVERRDERVLGLQPLQDRLRAGAAGERSASEPLTRSSIDVRSSSSRTSGGWRSSTSASR